MQETAQTVEPKTVTTQITETDIKPKPVEISKLSLNQRILLRALADEVMDSPLFKGLGNLQKQLYYSTKEMFAKPHGLEMQDIEGEEFWEKIEVAGQKKKEPKRFLRFKWNFYIPGTNSKISVEKRWRYEDFTA